MRSDDELLAAWRAGDLRAGNQLFARHFETVKRYFANKLDGDIEDLVQQTFEACVQGRDRYEGRAPFRAYLLRIARNRLYKHWADRNKRRAEDIAALSLADLGAGPSTLLAQGQQHQRLLVALRRLPLAQQELLELYYWEELSGPELAAVSGINENTLRTQLRRAKLALAEVLRQLELEAGAPECTQTQLEEWARSLRGLAAE